MRNRILLLAVLTALLGTPAWANMGLPIPRPPTTGPTTGPATEPGTQPNAPQPKVAMTPLGFLVGGVLVSGALAVGGLLLARSRRGH